MLVGWVVVVVGWVGHVEVVRWVGHVSGGWVGIGGVGWSYWASGGEVGGSCWVNGGGWVGHVGLVVVG